MKVCTEEHCDEPMSAKGLCRSHYNRQYYAGTTTLAPTSSACLQCGGHVKRQHSTGPAPSYCSARCRQAKNYGTYRESSAYQKQKERAKAATMARREAGNCKHCGAEWIKPRTDSTFCSTRCNTLWRDANGTTCSEPGCDRGVRAKHVCAMHYKVQSRAEGRTKPDVWDERRKANYQRRRALKVTTTVEDIRPLDVYERDAWMCGLCQGQVNTADVWPHPQSPSLDHVLPLSKGGTHTWDNVQLAHLRCNVSKGNRVAA